jgi:asparagine synthase (glutamine-hydrolysing)
VLLGGEGADELFLGYISYQKALTKERGRRFSPFKSGPVRSMDRLIRALPGKASWRLPDFTGTREGLGVRQLKTVLGPELRQLLADNPTLQLTEKLFKQFCDRTSEYSIEQWLGYVDIHMRLSSSLLPKLDIVTMQHGIECRLPFLDHRLVEWALGLPGGLKIREQQGKIILKAAVRDMLPDPVINRTKQGLSSPFETWFSLGLGVRMKKEVLDFSARTGFLAGRAVEDMFQTDARRSWYLYSFALWHRQFIERDIVAA